MKRSSFLLLTVITLYIRTNKIENQIGMEIDNLSACNVSQQEIKKRYEKTISKLFPNLSKKVNRRDYLEALVELYTHYGIV